MEGFLMKINALGLGAAAATTFCAAYTVIALALKFFPVATLKLIGTIHMMPKLDYIKSFITVTPQAIVIGMISHIIIAFLLFWLLATIYNLFQK